MEAHSRVALDRAQREIVPAARAVRGLHRQKPGPEPYARGLGALEGDAPGVHAADSRTGLPTAPGVHAADRRTRAPTAPGVGALGGCRFHGLASRCDELKAVA